ncbi:hypothetical protein [Arthrobacter sp. ISL-30]|uniref:hypothetical protein n=1 Tax=Arthrobacter sp. ISL-30 TaxID=2819109 RepID=UPI001BE8BBA7|nr:hypothetical protein [Arthrobacter sp. ISL-30]MBT2512797.1 hypothetical protein [Arthrobacter sp. ISL-30]
METKGDAEKPSTIGEGGAMEIVRVPAWQVKYDWSEDPDEVVHLVCCRDLDWRRAMCGYEEPSQDFRLPKDPCHGVVLPVTAEEYERLSIAWGADRV